MDTQYYKLVKSRSGYTEKIFPEGTPFIEVNRIYNELKLQINFEDLVVIKVTEKEIK